jgi:hypothetical protein
MYDPFLISASPTDFARAVTVRRCDRVLVTVFNGVITL